MWKQGIRKDILAAFEKIPRKEFVEEKYKQYAWQDRALPTFCGQTTTQPSLIADTIQALNLKKDDVVLEIGTGTGFQAAILSQIVKHVYTIERIKELAEYAKKVLKKLKIKNVTVIRGNGCKGLKKFCPYDAIILAAAVRNIPSSLIKQVKEGGKIIAPIENKSGQVLILFKKENGILQEIKKIAVVSFVKMICKE
jgi:protein-L-isoaspartate(D-aspartate) O-methyltransferase